MHPTHQQTNREERKKERKNAREEERKEKAKGKNPSRSVQEWLELADTCAAVLGNSTLHYAMQHIHHLVPGG